MSRRARQTRGRLPAEPGKEERRWRIKCRSPTSPGTSAWAAIPSTIAPEPGRTPPSALEGAAAQAEETYRAFVYEHYLEVPEEAAQALRDWADRVESQYVFVDMSGSDGSSDRATVPRRYRMQLELAERTALYLAAATTYDTTVPAVPEGADFVDYFLNQSGRGYCMHYATAAALFFRMAGIPARYVSGYTVMVPDSGRVDVPESAAHAWVEIYLDGYGWYPVEVTPAYGGETEGEGGAETVQPTPRRLRRPPHRRRPPPRRSAAPAPGPSGDPHPPVGPARAREGRGEADTAVASAGLCGEVTGRASGGGGEPLPYSPQTENKLEPSFPKRQKAHGKPWNLLPAPAGEARGGRWLGVLSSAGSGGSQIWPG